jgi:transcriptional regulator with XRE-family HTH domain
VPLDPVTIGAQLRALREGRGWSLRQVARDSGLTSGYLSQLERGEISQPRPAILEKLSQGYHVPVGQLMEWAGYAEPDPQAISPNQQVALNYLGNDLTEEEAKALRGVLNVIRGKSSATFSKPHHSELELVEEQLTVIRKTATGVLRELDVETNDEPVDIDKAFEVAKLVKAGAIELDLSEKKRLKKRFGGLVDKVLTGLMGVVHLGSKQVFINAELDDYEPRKRFVSAHEIGHAVLDDHRVAIAYLDDTSRLKPEFRDRLEREANQFSIELLAKGDRMRKDFDDSPPSVWAISSVSSKYNVSLQATARRVVEESRQECALIVVPRAHRRDGRLLPQYTRLYWSASFNARFQWAAGRLPTAGVKDLITPADVSVDSPPFLVIDAGDQLVELQVGRKDTPQALLILLVHPRGGSRRRSFFTASAGPLPKVAN